MIGGEDLRRDRNSRVYDRRNDQLMRTGDQEEKTSAQVLGTDSAAGQMRAG